MKWTLRMIEIVDGPQLMKRINQKIFEDPSSCWNVDTISDVDGGRLCGESTAPFMKQCSGLMVDLLSTIHGLIRGSNRNHGWLYQR